MSGDFEAKTPGSQLIATTKLEPVTENMATVYKQHTTLVKPGLEQLTASIMSNRAQIAMGQLTAADFEANRENLSNLTMIQLDKSVRGQQQQYFHLDNIFQGITTDQLLYRIPFQDNPFAAKEVGAREEYDTAHIVYDEISFDLKKIVTSWDIALEDPLRTLISPTIPLAQNNVWSLAFKKEKDAAVALSKLKYHYKKGNATDKPESHFTTTTTQTDTITNPEALTGEKIHSDNKSVNEIQTARNQFLQAFDIPLTHFACSPKTAMDLAQNTWTENNTIFNVEAYRTNGGVRAFPGLADATLVISLAVPDSVVYGVCKEQGALIKADGPKITKTWEENNKFTTRTAHVDFYQYKCAHEDLTKIDRKFGCIIDIATS